MPKRNPLPPVKIRLPRKPRPILPSPHKPRADTGDQPEMLEGMVQDKKASAPEERWAKTLGKLPSVDSFDFRYTIGAPRGLPGWKELDFLIASRGLMYAVEVDSEFTHRQKSGRSDVLHDAIVLNALKKQGMEVYPEVIHLNMESELVDQDWSDRTGKRMFG
jgi:hypothetical protein